MQVSRCAKLLILTMTVIIALSGCEFFFTSSRSVSRFSEPRCLTQEFVFQVNDDVTPLRLTLDLEVNQGDVKWRLVDPRGHERWVGRATGPDEVDESRLLDPIVGNWHFRVECLEAAGEFVIEWSGFKRLRP